MKRQILLFFLFTVSYISYGQLSFRTVAPRVAVVAGESFEVQYIVEGVESVEVFSPPPFSEFRLVAGPHIYKGAIVDLNISRPLVNTVYTLVASKPGRYIIPGATSTINGTVLHSNDIFIQVISKEEAQKRNKREDGSFFNNSEYFLHPGEDPIKKIQQNLFLKVTVDKRSCYVGEPVTATFKLYSRLESKSDIVKNPGFYGFAVHDMINLANRKQQTESYNGKTFDVHTIRQVQLYPLQAGRFMIDPLEISTKVEFSRSEVNKKTEQEIAEGLLGKDNSLTLHNNTELYENTMKTEEVPVTVKPLPAKNKTDSFTAAVGNFSIKAELQKGEVAKNEQDSMIIAVTGEGNFTQIMPPAITWPAGIDAFEPAIEDSIDRLHVPLKGTRIFRYKFISAKSGSYEIPALSFPFFNPATATFQTVSTKPLTVLVNNTEKVKETVSEQKSTPTTIPAAYWWIGAGVVLGLISFLLLGRQEKRKKPQETTAVDIIEEKPGIDHFLQPAQMMLIADDSKFYFELNKSVWNYFSSRTSFAGSGMNKTGLIAFLQAKGLESSITNELLSILQLCEAGIYTTAVHTDDKAHVLEKTKQLLHSIEAKLGE